MENKQTAVDILFQEIKESKSFLPDNLFAYLEDVYNKAKSMEKEQEFETKAYWFGRGILASKENRVDELKPKK
jgi:hypothetical protein